MPAPTAPAPSRLARARRGAAGATNASVLASGCLDCRRASPAGWIGSGVAGLMPPPASRSSSEHPVGQLHQRRTVRHQDHRTPAHQSPERIQHLLLGGAVEVGRRLVQQQHAARHAERRGPARRAVARRPTARPRDRRASHRARPACPRPPPAARPPPARPKPAAFVASGRPSRMLSAIEAANRWGRCGIQATRARQASGSRLARSTPPSWTDPACGATNPSSTASSVDFPHPLGPVSATISPGSTASEMPSSTGPPRPGKATRRSSMEIADTARSGTSVRRPCSGSGVSSTSNTWPAALRPSALA